MLALKVRMLWVVLHHAPAAQWVTLVRTQRQARRLLAVRVLTRLVDRTCALLALLALSARLWRWIHQLSAQLDTTVWRVMVCALSAPLDRTARR